MYAVIFSSKKSGQDPEGYRKAADRMSELAAQQEGFISADSVYDPQTHRGITVSFWTDLESIRKWKMNAEHRRVQAEGKKVWYSDFELHVVKVERSSKL